MATNKKHLDSKKYNKALTFEDRISLDKIISTNRDNDGSFKLLLNNVGDMLEKDPSTLSKEVKNRRTPIQSKTYCFAGSYCYQCSKNKTCVQQNVGRKFQLKCMDFEQMICKHLTKFPWVCNGCCKSGVCRLPKSYYNPKKSQMEYETTFIDCREGINMTLNEFKAIDVTNKLNEIESIIGIENYKKIFGVILTDNGTEFTDIRAIEMDPDTGEVKTNLYFCHPGASGEKGSCERNYELFRYILPNGTSFEGLSKNTLT